MPRRAREDAPGVLHHVTTRGIERRVIFVDDVDRRDFVDRLDRILPEAGMACFGWALMPNHVHLVVRTGERGLSGVMARLNTGYAKAFNERHDRVGHLFQNRFKSFVIGDDAYWLAAVRYVHLNPVRARIVQSVVELEAYPWTGHATLMGNRRARFQSTRELLAEFAENPFGAHEGLRSWMLEAEAAAEPRHLVGDDPGALEELIRDLCERAGPR